MMFGVYRLYRAEIKCNELSFASPCGEYRVEVYYYLREALIPMMPGSGSDKAGCCYVFRNSDNRKLHRAELPMIQDAHGVSFWHSAEGKYYVSIPCIMRLELEQQGK